MISQKLADKIAALAEEAKQFNDAETIALASILYTIKGSSLLGR